MVVHVPPHRLEWLEQGLENEVGSMHRTVSPVYPGFEAHISYNITPDLWASLDANYAFRGTTFVAGVDQNDAQKNLTVGTEMFWTLNSRNSIAFLFAKSVVHENAPLFTAVAVKYFYSWGPGY